MEKKGKQKANSMIEDRYKYRSVEVAKAILAVINEGRYGINMTKLQKLLYIVYGIYLVKTECRLTDEHPHAWPYGPVFPRLGRAYKTDELMFFTQDDVGQELQNDEALQECIANTVNTFGKYTAWQLTAWSHQKDSPWDVTRKSDGFRWNDIIADIYILDYFAKIYVPCDEEQV